MLNTPRPEITHKDRKMSASPHPHFFIVRPGGIKTSLIAVDELPPNFHIVGVPPVITDAQTQGMVSLGLVPSSGSCYVVQQDENSPLKCASLGPLPQSDSDKHGLCLPRKYKAPDIGLGSIDSLSPPKHEFHNSQEWHSPSSTWHGREAASRTQWCRPELRIDETQVGITSLVAYIEVLIVDQAIIDAVTTASTEAALHKSQQFLDHSADGSSHPARGKKIYCNYWLRKGECDYIQQGCLYKHEMPLDKATLASLGLREVPRWYREQWASVAASARSQREDHVNRPWRASKTASSSSNFQSDAPGTLSPPSTNTEPNQIRQIHVLSSTSPPSPPMRPRKVIQTSEQRQALNSNGTIKSATHNCNGSNGARLGTPKRNTRAQPVRPGSITPNTPIVPAKATGQYQSAHRRPGSQSQHQRDRARSAAELMTATAVMAPQVPLERSSQEAHRQLSSNATFYSGVPRTASPAHPRLFVKEGQGKYAVNPSAKSGETKTVVGRKSNSQVVREESSKTLNIFGDLGI